MTAGMDTDPSMTRIFSALSSSRCVSLGAELKILCKNGEIDGHPGNNGGGWRMTRNADKVRLMSACVNTKRSEGK